MPNIWCSDGCVWDQYVLFLLETKMCQTSSIWEVFPQLQAGSFSVVPHQTDVLRFADQQARCTGISKHAVY